jgi:hypothetical protein
MDLVSSYCILMLFFFFFSFSFFNSAWAKGEIPVLSLTMLLADQEIVYFTI